MSTDDFAMDSMLEVFIHETNEMLEQLDEILLDSERAKSITDENINWMIQLEYQLSKVLDLLPKGGEQQYIQNNTHNQGLRGNDELQHHFLACSHG